MWDFLTALLGAIPAAASSKEGLAAFAIAAAAYGISAWRVVRNKNLLENLERLPPKDRLRALEIEMGGVRLAKGISPEQWVRSRIHRYYFLAFIITCVVVGAVGAIALMKYAGSADVTVDLYQESKREQPSSLERLSFLGIRTSNAAQGNFVDPSTIAAKPAEDRRIDRHPADKMVTYEYKKAGSKILITASLPYLTKQRAGEPIQGHTWYLEPFNAELPRLSVKIVNNTSQTLLLSELEFAVTESKLNQRPIIAAFSPGWNWVVRLQNEGWGNVIDPTIRFNVKSPAACTAAGFSIENAHRRQLATFAETTSFNIRDATPEALIQTTCDPTISQICTDPSICRWDPPALRGIRCLDEEKNETCSRVSEVASPEYVARFLDDMSRRYKRQLQDVHYKRSCAVRFCVDGQLDYLTEDGQRESAKFFTIVYAGPQGPSMPLAPTSTYDVFLEAGKKGYQQRRSISQEIKPGQSDHFLIRIATNRSASFEFKMDVKAASGNSVWAGDIALDLLLPRSSARLHRLGNR